MKRIAYMTVYKRMDVILVPFPFSDLSYSKKRPALVLVDIPNRDELVCMMLTSTQSIDPMVDISIIDIELAGLPKPTVARVSRLFTLKQSLVSKKLGVIEVKEYEVILNRLMELIKHK
jgi:mRNA interferase MazF